MIFHELVLELFHLVTQRLVNLPALFTNLPLRIQLPVLLLGVHQFLELVLILVQELMKAFDDFILKMILINNFRINSYCISRGIQGQNVSIPIRDSPPSGRQNLLFRPLLFSMLLPETSLYYLNPKHFPH
ncbi:hypothetical protein D1872_222130 [compost metagenome]